MHFVLQTPPLQHLAGVKIVTHLWNQRDNFSPISITFFLLTERTKEWKEVEEKVKSKVSALSLPVPCKKELLNLITPIGMQVIAWCQCHNLDRDSSQFLDNLLPRKFCWSMHGTVEYKKTAELMVKDERVEVDNRYEIACINCLEDEARQLFECMGEERSQAFVNKVKKVRRREHPYKYIAYFTRNITGAAHRTKFYRGSSDSPSITVNRILFESKLLNGGTMGEYWFNRLSQHEKERVLEDGEMMRVMNRFRSSRCMTYFLSLMNEEQQRRTFRERTRHVLESFLRWPMKPLFVEGVECGWSYMNEKDCSEVLKYIVDKIGDGFGDCDYSQLFRECWRVTSAEYKQFYLDDLLALIGLLKTKEEEFIKLVLNEAPWNQLKGLLREIKVKWMDERVIGDAALMECKKRAALNSSNEPEGAEKRLRSQHLTRLVDLVLQWRSEARSDARFEGKFFSNLYCT